MSGLTPAQERFAEEYLVDLDPLAAALRAGYSKKGARRAAARNMEHPAVQLAIRQAKRRRLERLQITQDSVVRQLAAIGFTSMTDVCRWSADRLELLDSGELTDEQAAAIAEVTETTTARGGTVRIKLFSKLKALEMLARHVGLYDERPAGRAASPASAGPLSDSLRAQLDAMYASFSGPGAAVRWRRNRCTAHDPLPCAQEAERQGARNEGGRGETGPGSDWEPGQGMDPGRDLCGDADGGDL